MDRIKITMLLTTIQMGSFNKAAEKLHCTQSAITQAMNSLEKELGVKILKRSHNGISLTPEGEQLLPTLTATQDALNALASEAKRITSGIDKPLRIGTFSSISTSWLPIVLKKFKEEYGFSNFNIRVGTNRVTQWLLNGEIDIALIDDLRNTPFRFYPLLEDPYYAVTSEHFMDEKITQISAEELITYPFIITNQSALDMLFPKMPAECITVYADSEKTALTMVEKGLGVTALPALCLKNISNHVKLIPIMPKMARTLGIALPNAPTKIAQEFSKFLRQHIK